MDSKQKQKRPALGRGLSALISSAVPVFQGGQEPATASQTPEASKVVPFSSAPKTSFTLPVTDDENVPASERSPVTYLPISEVINNLKQPRQDFGESELNELAESIRTLGVLQPVLVRPKGQGGSHRYEIVAGERRWRAAQRANLTHIPVIIKELDDQATLEIALVENIQRENLNPLELARSYNKLIEEFSLTQEEVASRVGKDRASVANYVRLLRLPDEVQKMLLDGRLSMGHARAILTVREPAAQINLANKVASENLSVRAVEEIVSRVVVLDRNRRKARSKNGVLAGAGDYPEITDRLRKVLGTKVAIRHQESGRGKIEIEYFSEQELERLVEILES